VRDDDLSWPRLHHNRDRLPQADCPRVRAPDGGPIHYEHHRPNQTTLYRLLQQL
jgi:hypothetical protein